jgi:hypothetical protein
MLPPGYSIGWQLIGSRALEAHHTLGLLLAVGHAVGVVADMLLGGVGQALLAGGLIRHASSALNRKGGLHATQWSRTGPSGRGSHTLRQQRTEQRERVDEI